MIRHGKLCFDEKNSSMNFSGILLLKLQLWIFTLKSGFLNCEFEYSSQKQFCVKFEYLNFRAKNDVEYLRKDRISSTSRRHFWREVCLLSRYRVQLSIQFDEFSFFVMFQDFLIRKFVKLNEYLHTIARM